MLFLHDEKNEKLVGMTEIYFFEFIYAKQIHLQLKLSKAEAIMVWIRYESWYSGGLYANCVQTKKSHKLKKSVTLIFIGGNYWVRTSDPLLVRQML